MRKKRELGWQEATILLWKIFGKLEEDNERQRKLFVIKISGN